ncbi:hypothetical protein D9Y31_00395 [Acinetobacter baumannii]|uniref:hypothetical protein n=1 Tax=Acinetobacter baumannii TaxID=470 RepID=UPI0010CC497B|nr:hypothetical protein [Acinetobacter baumannii]TKV65876.1 hypothetical protein D9Y31_00395 [Acinetobacter baumannii]TKV70150.1 hypothetical protein D9Y30_02090 [Acinetobacter baumannii]
MSVPEQIPYVGYVANGQTTEFPITFDLHDPEYLIVTVNKEIPVVGTYTVDMNALKVVFATAPAEGTQVELYRETELNRDTNYQKYDNSFRPEAVNYDFDKIWHVLQEQDMIDAELLARLKGEIEWRRTHDANFDELALMRDSQVFSGLKQYVDTYIAATNPNIFEGITAGIVFALDKKSVQTHLEIIYQQLADERLRAQQAEQSLDNKITTEKNRALAAEQNLQLQITTSANGIKYFETEAQLLAFVPGETDPKQAYAFDTKKNYLWDAANSVWKDEGISAVNSAINVLSKVNSLLNLNSAIQANTFYHTLNGTTVVKDSNAGLFAVEADVSEGDYLILNSQSYPNIGAYFITDSSNTIIDTMGTNEILTQPYLVKIPANAAKLYLNCINEYADKFNISKIPTGYIELLYTGNDRQQFTYYTSSNGSPVTKNSNHGVFAVEMAVQEGDYYLIDTKGFGIAGEYYVTDENNNPLSFMLAADGTDLPYLLKIPKLGVKLFVNCSYSYEDTFSIKKLSSTVLRMLALSGKRQDFTFYYAPAGTIKQENNTGLFAVEASVVPGQNYSIDTKSFGVVGEYYITDSAGNVLQFKAADSVDEDYIITIPDNAAKLYVNCTYDYADNFNVERISNALLAKIPDVDMTVRSTFPSFNYFDKLKVKCPNFYQKFKDKNEDVTVVLTGTSLTQGNLYTTDRADASTRPAALHTHDLASSVFDKLIKHWDGQKYRRYDHADLTYSSSSWSVVNQLPDFVWDDYAHIKNGLTKTTTDANASVSMTIPANAWQFNFVYRSDGQCGNCTVSIAEGNSKVEAWNGSAWVEANGFVFSMYEGPATSTKGNTQYQKRLKMRCKNRASGGINSIGSTKQITISKGNNSNRFNVVGFEWSQREFMLFVINGARGGFEWGDPNGNRLDQYQDTDIWSFNPDLLLAEITTINWGASDPAALNKDPLHYVNNAKRAYFNEFNDMPTSLYAKSSGYTVCDVIFYSDTLAASSAVAGAWDSVTHEPKFGVVSEAATNGGPVDNINVGRAKTNFENYEAVERYIASKEYLFIPILSSFKYVAEKFYGGYWLGMQASDKTGNTLSYDGVHFNDNGAALFSKIVASVFDEI